MLTTGISAPSFTLPDSEGNAVSLADFAGEWLLFWWYPEANSSGCSMQAASLDRAHDALAAAGVRVLGVSFNTAVENGDFAEAESLRFPLLSDPQKTAGAAYEVIREKGAPFEAKPLRYTYLIDPAGTVVYAENASDHPLATYGEHVLEIVARLQAA
jgi:peroxiredoxin Q/BCP